LWGAPQFLAGLNAPSKNPKVNRRENHNPNGGCGIGERRRAERGGDGAFEWRGAFDCLTPLPQAVSRFACHRTPKSGGGSGRLKERIPWNFFSRFESLNGKNIQHSTPNAE
jgi:hypothetical protein